MRQTVKGEETNPFSLREKVGMRVKRIYQNTLTQY